MCSPAMSATTHSAKQTTAPASCTRRWVVTSSAKTTTSTSITAKHSAISSTLTTTSATDAPALSAAKPDHCSSAFSCTKCKTCNSHVQRC